MRQNMKLKNAISGILTGTLIVGGIATAAAEIEKGIHEQQLECLAMNIYYEARGSNLADKAGVADVVLNRVNDSRYPDSICEVVHQGKQKPSWKDPNKMVMVRNMCQFSWYCDGKSDVPQNEDLWQESQLIAYNMITYSKFRGISEGATHYHATYVNPSWAKDLQQVGRLGSHIYYRWE